MQDHRNSRDIDGSFRNAIDGNQSLSSLVGQNRLFERLRNDGYLIKGGSSKNMPTQRSMEMGLFEIKESSVVMPNGSIRINKTPKVTGKGQIYFINLFLGER